MLGQRTIATPVSRGKGNAGRVVIVADHISIDDARTRRVRDASFIVRAGEIVGVAAVEGSGHRELLRAVARRLRVSAGTLSSPDVVGFVPDDRHRDGLALSMSLTENLALRDAGERQGVVPWRDVHSATQKLITDFDVRATGPESRAAELSGGNQQKFVLGRELIGPPTALVVENATRGLDIRAAAYVHDRLLLARAIGVAIMAYSADLDEILSIADRMLVVFEGLVQEVPVDRELVGRAMLGAA